MAPASVIELRPFRDTDASFFADMARDARVTGFVGHEIGYRVSPEHWGKGIAQAMITEAVTRIPGLFGVRSLVAGRSRGSGERGNRRSPHKP